MSKEFIWQPEGISQSASQFKIRLDGAFALETVQMIGDRYRSKIQEMAEDLLSNREGCPKTPLRFHEDTYFLRQINLRTGGVWLAVDDMRGAPPSGKDIVYSLHNATGSDAISAMAMLEFWVNHKETIKEYLR